MSAAGEASVATMQRDFSQKHLLQVSDLTLAIHGDPNQKVVERISFDVSERGVLAIVGESGCGKSVTALTLLRLIEPAVQALSGKILFEGEDVLSVTEAQLRALRGAKMSMIFQEPMTSLNPILTVGYQLIEAVQAHRPLGRKAAYREAVEMLSLVGIPSPEARMQNYPHQLSGGMCQRVMIALALACRPQLLIADEPTTALDVTIQAQIIELLRKLQRDLGMAVIIITHDLGLVSNFAHEVAVMYAGRIVEHGQADVIFELPAHPYTERLLASIPPVDRDVDRLATIEGSVPAAWTLPPGCKFAPRCPRAQAVCREQEPQLLSVPQGSAAACHFPSIVAATLP